MPPVLTSLLPEVTLPGLTVPEVSIPPITLPELEPPDEPPGASPPGGSLYVQPAGEERTLLRLDWAGRELARLVVDQPVGCCGLQTSSPDGSQFRLGFDLYSSDGVRRGQLPGHPWGDDGDHACSLRPVGGAGASGPWTLEVHALTGSQRSVATIPAAAPGTAATVVTCNPQSDRAVVFVGNPPVRRTIVVRLSDGQVSDAPPGCSQGYSVSPDGRLLVAAPPGERPMVCDLDRRSVVAQLHRPGQIVGDGTAILTYELDHCGGKFHAPTLTDWRTGEQIWSTTVDGPEIPCDEHLLDWKYHPDAVAVAFQVTRGDKSPGDVYISSGRNPPRKVVEDAAYAVVF